MKINWDARIDRVSARLKALELGGPERSKALGALGNALSNRIKLGFRMGVSPYGVKWKPLNPAYRVGQPLRDTGRLQRSIGYQVHSNAVDVGTNVRYAAVHQFGRTIRPREAQKLRVPLAIGGFAFLDEVTIPARPFLPISGGKVVLPPAWAKSALNALAKSMGLQ